MRRSPTSDAAKETKVRMGSPFLATVVPPFPLKSLILWRWSPCLRSLFCYCVLKAIKTGDSLPQFALFKQAHGHTSVTADLVEAKLAAGAYKTFASSPSRRRMRFARRGAGRCTPARGRASAVRSGKGVEGGGREGEEHAQRSWCSCDRPYQTGGGGPDFPRAPRCLAKRRRPAQGDAHNAQVSRL